MHVNRMLSMLVVTVGLVGGPSAWSIAQETPRPKDDALDSLLEDLTRPSDRAAKSGDQAAKKDGPGARKDAAKAKEAGSGSASGRPATSGAKDGKADGKKAEGPASLTGKDQEVDALLEKLGETTETPAPDERRGGAPGGGEKPDARGPGQQPDRSDRSRLSGKDKETDEHLEELTGRKRRKKGDSDERSGPAGEIIKEMREIEQKLGKPDTGESTREEQKKVVKQIDTMIEEARQSGQSSMRRMVVRRVRQPGQQGGGQQPGSTTGAMAQGTGPSKPRTPTSKHSTAGGKDIWGHLPEELRAEIENMMNEQPLNTMEELIERYYLSLGKREPRREESP